MGTDTITWLEWVPLAREIEKLPQHRQAEINELIEKARGYIWGWQDCGGKTPSNAEWNFPIVYGWHCQRFASEQTCSRMPIRSAFEKYCKGEEI